METYQDELTAINAALDAAECHRGELARKMAALELAGMYPAIPAEQWQDRGGAGQYLYMIFRLGPDGQYLGPDGKRKVYVGNDPARIAEARRLAENRRRWEVAQQARQELERWIADRRQDLKDLGLSVANLARRSERWPTFDLGQVTPAAAGTPSPKAEG